MQHHLRGRMAGQHHRLGLEGPEPQPVPGAQRAVAPRQVRHDRAVAVEPLPHAVELLLRQAVAEIEAALGAEVVRGREPVHPRGEVFRLAHGEFGAGAPAQPGGGADVVGMVMGDDQALDGAARHEPAEHAFPQRPRRRRVDAGVDHGPAALALDQVHVDVVQAERQRQAQPVKAGRDLQRRTIRGRMRERVVERDHGLSSSVSARAWRPCRGASSGARLAAPRPRPPRHAG